MAVFKLQLQSLVSKMMPGTNMVATNHIKLPFAFIIYGLCSFIIAQAILLFHMDIIINGAFRTPPIWMAAHFLVLGFIVMIIMGAMYQLVPVAFLTPIWNHTFGYVQYGVTGIGIMLFAISLGYFPSHSIYGAIITLLGIIMFIMQMTLSIRKQKKKNKMTLFVLSALACFFIAILFGLLLAWNLSFTTVFAQDALLGSHIVFGVAGWFTLLIFGFSYKLIPMFSLSHGFSQKWAIFAWIFYLSGLLTIVITFWIPIPYVVPLGFCLLFIGFTFFILDIYEILQKRLRRKLDTPISFAVLAIMFGFIIHLIACIVSIAGVSNPIIWGWIIFFYMICWVIFSILGYLYKIVPFLWWTYKYADLMGKEKVPTLAEMVNEKTSKTLYILFLIGITGLLLGAVLGVGLLVLLFQLLLTLTTIAYCTSIVRILFV